MTDSIIPFRLIVVARILISLPCPLMIAPRLNKIARYTSDSLPDVIYVTSGNYVSNLDSPSESPQLIVLNYNNPNTHHTITSYKPFHIRGKIGY